MDAPPDDGGPVTGTAAARTASTAGAVAGGLALVVLALPLLAQAVLWSVLSPGAVPWPALLAMAAAGLVPVPLAAGVAHAQRAHVRATAALVGVPQAVLSVPLVLYGLWGWA